MGTSTFEAKLAEQLAGITHELLFHILLNVRKAYDSLYRGQCMEILWVYGMGQNTVRLIAHHWDSLIRPPQCKKVPRDAVWKGEKNHTRRLHVPYDI